MINTIQSRRAHAQSQVAKDRPERMREMISKTVPTDVKSTREGKGEVYHEGYVDGKLFLVPDSNLEAMRDTVNFKMMPRNSVRYKHQSSYEINDYDHVKSNLVNLIDKVRDLPPPDLNEMEEEDNEDEESIKEEEKEKEKEKSGREEQKLQEKYQNEEQFQDTKDDSEEDEQTSDEQEGEVKNPEFIAQTAKKASREADDIEREESEEENEQSLRKEDPITEHKFTTIKGGPRTNSKARTDSETIETVSDEEFEGYNEGHHETKPTDIRSSKDQREICSPTTLEEDEEKTGSEARTKTETEEESNLYSQKQDQSKPAGLGTVEDQGVFIPFKLEEEAIDFRTMIDTETEEESNLDSQEQDLTKPGVVPEGKDQGGVFIHDKLTACKTGTKSESEQESEVGSEDQDIIPGNKIPFQILGGPTKLTVPDTKSKEETLCNSNSDPVSRSRSVTESEYYSGNTYDPTDKVVPTSKHLEGKFAPTIGELTTEYKPASEIKHEPKLDERYTTKHEKVPNKYTPKYNRPKQKLYPKSDKLYVRLLISGHFNNGKKPIYIIQEYNGDNLFKDEKTDIFTSEKNGDVDILIRGKYFSENILEESNGKPIALKTKPNKIIIDQTKSKVFDEFVELFNMKTAVILVKGQFITNPDSNKVTPLIRFHVEKKFPMEQSVDELIQNIHNYNKPITVMSCNPYSSDPFSRKTISICDIDSCSTKSNPFPSKDLSSSLSKNSSLETGVNLSNNKQVIDPEILRNEIQNVNDTKPKIDQFDNNFLNIQGESHTKRLNNNQGKGYLNFLKDNTIYKILFGRKKSKSSSKIEQMNA